MYLNQAVSERLKELLAEKNMTQYALYKRCGVPKSTIGTLTGIAQFAAGAGSFIVNKSAGALFTYAAGTTMVDGKEVEMTKDLLASGAQYVRPAMEFLGYTGKPAGYCIVFGYCAVAYIVGWTCMKVLVPKYKPVVID